MSLDFLKNISKNQLFSKVITGYINNIYNTVNINAPVTKAPTKLPNTL